MAEENVTYFSLSRWSSHNYITNTEYWFTHNTVQCQMIANTNFAAKIFSLLSAFAIFFYHNLIFITYSYFSLDLVSTRLNYKMCGICWFTVQFNWYINRFTTSNPIVKLTAAVTASLHLYMSGTRKFPFHRIRERPLNQSRCVVSVSWFKLQYTLCCQYVLRASCECDRNGAVCLKCNRFQFTQRIFTLSMACRIGAHSGGMQRSRTDSRQWIWR